MSHKLKAQLYCIGAAITITAGSWSWAAGNRLALALWVVSSVILIKKFERESDNAYLESRFFSPRR